MKNKGFSLIELIVVIAIMALLVAALAPNLMRYINKSRLSKDMDTGSEIAKAILAVVTEDDVRDNAEEHSEPVAFDNMDGADFKQAVLAHLSTDNVVARAKYDIHGNELEGGNPKFYYTLDSTKNKVEIYLGGTDPDYRIYPSAGNNFIK